MANLIQRGNLSFLGPPFKTHISNTTHSKPDIILGNNRIHHNIHIAPGPLTSSDHIPLIVTISDKPIKTSIPTTYDFNRADWEGFQNYCTNNINIMQIDQNSLGTKQEIDTRLDKWFKTIKDAADLFIPKKQMKNIPSIQQSLLQSNCQYHYNQLLTQASQMGWSLENLQRFKEIKSILILLAIQAKNSLNNLMFETRIYQVCKIKEIYNIRTR